jgi:hypothetical protein
MTLTTLATTDSVEVSQCRWLRQCTARLSVVGAPGPDHDGQGHHLRVLPLGGVLVSPRGWWGAEGWTLLFDLLLNGYPVMLQRYNRALLDRRYSLSLTNGPPRRQHEGSG